MHRSILSFFILRAAIGVSICAVIVAWCFSPAFAAQVTLNSKTSHPHSMTIYKGQKFKSAGTNLVYQGGAVETTPVVYISWWGKQWNTGFSTGGYSSAKAQTYMTDFFSNVGGSSWDNINTQYCQGIAVGSTSCGSGGTHITNPAGQLKGTWVDTTSVPTRPTQSQIQSAATRLMNHFGGYNGNGYFDGFSIMGGHEYAEAMTDPHPERTSTNFGWITNTGSSGEEIGDLCAWASNSTNITLGSHSYAVQPLWSNASTRCVTSY